MRIALLGAESTGKTDLSQAIAGALRVSGLDAAVVPEVLREWCDRAGRTPRPHEQMGIAQAQAERVEAAERALAPASVVVADTTPLMIAVYSDLLFDDRSLYEFALAHQRSYAMTLVMGLDMPWVADGLQRDGPHVRAPVDALLRNALDGAGLAYQLVYGRGSTRLHNALAALQAGVAGLEGLPARRLAADAQRPRWVCDKCSDPDCEHKLFSRLAPD